MSRYMRDVITAKDTDEVRRLADELLAGQGFRQVNYGSETVWKKGHGLALGPQYSKVEPGEGKVHIEAWVRIAVLPGLYMGEMGTDGFIGAIPKRRLKTRVLEVVRSLS